MSDAIDLLMTEHLHPEDDSPLCGAEILYKSMVEAHLQPEISPCTSLLESPGQKSFRSCLPAEEGVKGRFAINFRPGNRSPVAGESNLRPPLIP
jgi:hypothetical protein